MADFRLFSRAVDTRFAHLSKGELFVVDIDKDVLWDRYLASFPAGSDPMFRKRTEHDCSCCKNFIRNIGNVVAIVDGVVETIWELKGLESPYAEVAAAMDAFVKIAPVVSVYRTKETGFGKDQTLEYVDGSTRKWNHFHCTVSAAHRVSDVGPVLSNLASTQQVFARGLNEISPSAVDTVLDLIGGNAIYRGKEFEALVREFQKAQTAYRKTNHDKALFVWTNLGNKAARIKNTSIGELLMNLSEGKSLDAAVNAFEKMVAPEHYKRPTAIITPTMVKNAMKTIADLGLEPALERRHARLEDVSVNNVLWADHAVKPLMKDGIEGLLMETVVQKKPNIDRAENISMDDFLRDVLPRASSMDVFVENRMLGNFMSITAPVNPGNFGLFKWNNEFAWSYDGNVADSIKERVKRAGGDVDAALRVSLSWKNTDDLDIHVIEPNGNHIYFGNKAQRLDVDMNVSAPVRNAVENVRWKGKPPSGKYQVRVNNYRKRESIDVGFEIELENNGVIHNFSYERAVQDSAYVDVITFTVDAHGVVTDIQMAKDIKGSSAAQDKWGITTGTLVKVNTLLLSPNYWDDNAVGNKHWFFVMDGCKNPEPTRGIYNEYLSGKLDPHRKVFEMVGEKTKCPVADNQMSGLGFSSTRNDKATVLVTGPRLQKAYTINF